VPGQAAAADALGDELEALLVALLQLWQDLSLQALAESRDAGALLDWLCAALLQLAVAAPGQPHAAQRVLAALQQPRLRSACYCQRSEVSEVAGAGQVEDQGESVGAGKEEEGGEGGGEVGSGAAPAAGGAAPATMREALLAAGPQLLQELLRQPARREPPGTTGWGCASRDAGARAASCLLLLLDVGLGAQLDLPQLRSLGALELAAVLPLPAAGELGGAALAALHVQLAELLVRQLGWGRGLGDGEAAPLVAALLQYLQVRGPGGGCMGAVPGAALKCQLGRGACCLLCRPGAANAAL
jgi:hypothetical protein